MFSGFIFQFQLIEAFAEYKTWPSCFVSCSLISPQGPKSEAKLAKSCKVVYVSVKATHFWVEGSWVQAWTVRGYEILMQWASKSGSTEYEINESALWPIRLGFKKAPRPYLFSLCDKILHNANADK